MEPGKITVDDKATGSFEGNVTQEVITTSQELLRVLGIRAESGVEDGDFRIAFGSAANGLNNAIIAANPNLSPDNQLDALKLDTLKDNVVSQLATELGGDYQKGFEWLQSQMRGK